jgi:hypothetical protein
MSEALDAELGFIQDHTTVMGVARLAGVVNVRASTLFPRGRNG